MVWSEEVASIMNLETVIMMIMSFLLGAVITAFGYTVTLKADMAIIKNSPLFKNTEMVSNLVVVCKEHDQMKIDVNTLKEQMTQIRTQHEKTN